MLTAGRHSLPPMLLQHSTQFAAHLLVLKYWESSLFHRKNITVFVNKLRVVSSTWRELGWWTWSSSGCRMSGTWGCSGGTCGQPRAGWGGRSSGGWWSACGRRGWDTSSHYELLQVYDMWAQGRPGRVCLAAVVAGSLYSVNTNSGAPGGGLTYLHVNKSLNVTLHCLHRLTQCEASPISELAFYFLLIAFVRFFKWRILFI